MKFFIPIALAVLAFFALIIHGVNADEARADQRQQEWLQFSMQHHCHVVREHSFSNPTDLWQCDDNFQIQR